MNLWDLRRGQWSPELVARARARVLAWCRDQRPTAPSDELEDDVLASELLLRLEAMPLPGLADALDQVEVPRFPDHVAPVVAALRRRRDAQLEALRALDGDPVDHLVAVLDSMTASERTAKRTAFESNRARASFVGAVHALAVVGTERALGILLARHTAAEHAKDPLAEEVIEAVISLGARALDPALALWPSLEPCARHLVLETLKRGHVDDDPIWRLLAAWLDGTSGTAVADPATAIASYAYPSRDLPDAGLPAAGLRIARAEQLLQARLARAHDAHDDAATEAIDEALADIATFPTTQREPDATQLEQQVHSADLVHRLWLASVKDLPLAFQQVLATDPVAAVRRALAMRNDLPPPIQQVLATDPDVDVRWTIAARARRPAT